VTHTLYCNPHYAQCYMRHCIKVLLTQTKYRAWTTVELRVCNKVFPFLKLLKNSDKYVCLLFPKNSTLSVVNTSNTKWIIGADSATILTTVHSVLLVQTLQKSEQLYTVYCWCWPGYNPHNCKQCTVGADIVTILTTLHCVVLVLTLLQF